MANKKRMTNREKEERARLKKKLQADGMIPPDKPKLNRKKYVEEAWKEWNDRDRGRYRECLVCDMYIYEAFAIMIGAVDRNMRVSQEAVGVAKTLKLAIRLREFHEKIYSEGRTEYTLKEQMDFIMDILKA